jgi:hypothetical protein
VEAVDAVVACVKITADGDGLCECGSGEDEKGGEKIKGEKECGGHRV